MKAAEWLVVLSANGVVESIDGGAPEEWRGKHLPDLAGAPGIVRRAATELIHESTHYVRRKKVRCTDGDSTEKHEVSVEILLVEALPLRRAPTAAHDLVMRTLDLFASQAKSSRIDLNIETAPDLPATLLMDGEKVAWALSTLVANALRYAREHVRVRVSTDEKAHELLINVSDDGPGVPEEKLRWLFERDPESGQAVGLALPMVKDIMAAHRGSVSVHSLAGRGTRFTLRLPT